MKTISVSQGQNMLDVSIQEYGSIAAVMQLCMDNNIPIDYQLKGGETLLIDESKIIDPRIVKYFKDRKQKVNTGWD